MVNASPFFHCIFITFIFKFAYLPYYLLQIFKQLHLFFFAFADALQSCRFLALSRKSIFKLIRFPEKNVYLRALNE